MAIGALTRLYERLGRRYPFAFLAVELQSALLIVAGTLALITFYYEGSTGEYLLILAITLAMTEAAIIAALVRARPLLRTLSDWIGGERDPEATERAWGAAISLPLHLVKRDLPLPVTVSAVVTCAAGVAIFGLSAWAVVPLLAASAISIGYAIVLHYLAVEIGMRPVLIEIDSSRSPRRSADFWALPLRTRLLVSLPLINLITGLVVAALTSDGGGASNLGLDVLVALAVATTISLELTVMLSKSILRPVRDLERAVAAVREGRHDITVPVTTGDELGELAASFNQMVAGLAERERLREAFGTYLDREVADYILSEGFDESGVEAEVSVMFCDVRGFTGFAAERTPKQVVAALNELFELIVPAVARHGGHVDKFEGDGLLAVFGVPQPFADHADRALRAACEVAAAVNHRGAADGLRIGVGVNSGTVIAGAIGGAGRLNYSVIGGAVNVAARVEAHTRVTGDDVLLTGETLERLERPDEIGVESRGGVELRGVGEVELFAPPLAAEVAPDQALGRGALSPRSARLPGGRARRRGRRAPAR
jgi:class 3 adenylate cyclase